MVGVNMVVTGAISRNTIMPKPIVKDEPKEEPKQDKRRKKDVD